MIERAGGIRCANEIPVTLFEIREKPLRVIAPSENGRGTPPAAHPEQVERPSHALIKAKMPAWIREESDGEIMKWKPK